MFTMTCLGWQNYNEIVCVKTESGLSMKLIEKPSNQTMAQLPTCTNFYQTKTNQRKLENSTETRFIISYVPALEDA